MSRVGSMFIVEPSGPRLTDMEKRQLERLRPVGVMFRKRNFLQDCDYDTWFKAYASLVRDLRETIGREDLIISIDHEGGRIIRPPTPITRFPYAAKWGEHVAQVAQAMTLELTSLGVNLTCSPVADVHSNPDNPVINQRAFGQTPEQVAEAATTFFETVRDRGVTCCAKHFPGHGDTAVDSHFELPILDLTTAQLRERELIPFQTLIERGIPMMMTGHLMLPSLDAENPVTTSAAAIDGLLRKEMGFDGVVISDGLGMKAIVDRLENPQAVIGAVQAGLDVFLVVGDEVSLSDAQRWAGFIEAGLKKGILSEVILCDSLERGERLLSGMNAFEPKMLESSTFAMHQELADSLRTNDDWGDFDLSLPGFE